MEHSTSDICDTCPGKVVCHCLQITEGFLVHAITTGEIRELKDLRCQTGAGDGCTACHAALKTYLERFSLTLVS